MLILAIDPGSTSTKIGVLNEQELVHSGVDHDREIIGSFREVHEQEQMRFESITSMLEEMGFAGETFDAVVGRGGLIKPVGGGVYAVCDTLLSDLKNGTSGSHASNLGGVLARRLAAESGCPAFIVDPVVVDEMCDEARLSGLAGIERKSIFHALNQKAVARRVAVEMGRSYFDVNLIVAHMGGGITVGAHEKGKVVDVNNGLNGDGPYAPERSGGLPVDGIIEAIERGDYTLESLGRAVSRAGGIFSYLGIVDLREVERRIAEGDSVADLVWRGMVYQVVKAIGGLAASLEGEVDAIVLTGGMAHSKRLTEAISCKVGFLAETKVVPGEFELEALTAGALRVLSGEEEALNYAEKQRG